MNDSLVHAYNDTNSTTFTDDSSIRRPLFDAIDLWATPLWYVLGIPGNLVAYIVWIQRRLRHSSGCYLAALALDECIFLILQVRFMNIVHNFSLLPRSSSS